jgi:two-component system CheB/CheR fusion protein
MTGDADSQEDVVRLFDVCLQKPFSSEALMQVIEDARSSSNASCLLAA